MKIEPDKAILPHPKATPSKTETHDLKDVLQRKVIFNKPRNTPEDAKLKTSESRLTHVIGPEPFAALLAMRQIRLTN